MMDAIIYLPCVLINAERQFFEAKTINDEDYKEIIFNEIWNKSLYAHILRMNYYWYIHLFSEAEKEFNIVEQLFEEKETLSDKCVFESKIHFYKEVCRTAAEIYSNLDDYDNALKYFKIYQYYSIQLKSEFEGFDSCFLYSFRRVNQYSLYDLSSNSITVCNPKLMNDPFDSLFLHWGCIDNLNSTCTKTKHVKAFSDSYKYFRIRSFVGNKKLKKDVNIINNVAMWSYYGDDHKGFCILYNFSPNIIKRVPNDDYIHWYLKRIIYTNKKISILKHTINSDELFATKYKSWQKEKEVRLISYNPNIEKDYNYIPLDDKSSIKAIYFGYRCTDENITLIKSILGNKVDYYKMEMIPENIYRMRLKKL